MRESKIPSRHVRTRSSSAYVRRNLRLFFILLGFYLAYRLVQEWIARRQARPAPTAPPAIELPPEIEVPVELPPPVEAAEPPVAAPAPAEAEAPPEELVFGLPVAVAPPTPDVHLTVPPDVVLASFDPKYQFNWQNPTLRDSIYPFRKNKLIDFLAIYDEIDLVKEYRGKPSGDPAIQAQIAAAESELLAARQQVETALNEKIEAYKKIDPTYFGRIDRPGVTNLTFKYTYFVGREVDRLEDKIEDLEEQKKTLLKRVAWYEDGDARQQLWRDRAAELDPKIKTTHEALAPLRELQQLFKQQAELPKVGAGSVTVKDVMRWEMRNKRIAYEKLTLDQLMEAIVNRINADPDRFPEWMVYMVIHFSGMRYISAHGSWAAPCFLIQVLEREDIEDEINNLIGDQLIQKCTTAASEIQAKIKPGAVDSLQKTLASLLSRLQNPVQQKRALLEYRTDKTLGDIQTLNDDACLDRLVEYKARRDLSGDPIPEWVWAEIVKYTPLRLNTDDPDWEAFSPERWQFQNRRWAEVLNEWERKDITSWRAKHKESLDLVVTRSVCNELGEHIQHLRGLTPAAGLTSKPNWYLRQVAKDPKRAYFVQAPDESHFKTGASIFWLEWMAQQPSPWQVAHPITGFTFIPGQAQIKKGQKGEVRKRDLVDKDWDETGGWSYKQVGDAYQRDRKLPGRQELKAMGKKPDEINKLLAEQQKTGGVEREYLRWRHEATVVDVVDMIDGRFVLTFETGKIGLILRSLASLEGNPMVFAGYLPEVPSLPPEMDKKLVEMLRWDRILPGKTLKSRVRPLKKASADTPPATAPGVQGQPEREVLVVREMVKCMQMQGRDNQGRPKFVGAVPPVKLTRGMRVSVLATHKESLNDRGDGVIHSLDGEYYKINRCNAEPKAVGKFIPVKDTANYATGRWVKVNPTLVKTNVQVLKGYDLAGKPFFEPTPQINRVQIPGGARLRISTTHRESNRDIGDGKINSSGLKNIYHLILECPAVPAANGYFIESDEIVPESP